MLRATIASLLAVASGSARSGSRAKCQPGRRARRARNSTSPLSRCRKRCVNTAQQSGDQVVFLFRDRQGPRSARAGRFLHTSGSFATPARKHRPEISSRQRQDHCDQHRRAGEARSGHAANLDGRAAPRLAQASETARRRLPQAQEQGGGGRSKRRQIPLFGVEEVIVTGTAVAERTRVRFERRDLHVQRRRHCSAGAVQLGGFDLGSAGLLGRNRRRAPRKATSLLAASFKTAVIATSV